MNSNITKSDPKLTCKTSVVLKTTDKIDSSNYSNNKPSIQKTVVAAAAAAATATATTAAAASEANNIDNENSNNSKLSIPLITEFLKDANTFYTMINTLGPKELKLLQKYLQLKHQILNSDHEFTKEYFEKMLSSKSDLHDNDYLNGAATVAANNLTDTIIESTEQIFRKRINNNTKNSIYESHNELLKNLSKFYHNDKNDQDNVSNWLNSNLNNDEFMKTIIIAWNKVLPNIQDYSEELTFKSIIKDIEDKYYSKK